MPNVAALKRRNPHIVQAHRMLQQLEPDMTPPLDCIRVQPCPHGWYARCNGGHIEIDPSSPWYRAAEQGNYTPLAALMVHENYHRHHGGDERGAYATEIEFLEKHHSGDQALIAEVPLLAALALKEETPMTDDDAREFELHKLTAVDMHVLIDGSPVERVAWWRKRRAWVNKRRFYLQQRQSKRHVPKLRTHESVSPEDDDDSLDTDPASPENVVDQLLDEEDPMSFAERYAAAREKEMSDLRAASAALEARAPTSTPLRTLAEAAPPTAGPYTQHMRPDPPLLLDESGVPASYDLALKARQR